jgi:hypothetical protein
LAQQLHPRIVEPDHSPPGDASLITQTRAFMAELDARIAALKSQGRSAADAAPIVAAEMQAKYPDWTSVSRVSQGVTNAYANSGN